MKERKNRPLFISFMILLTYLVGNMFLFAAGLYHFFFGKDRSDKNSAKENKEN